MPEIPVVNCVLLWARPGMEAELSAYEDKVLRLVGEHGGRVLQRGTVLPGAQHDGEPPTEVQFLEMPSEASLDAYVNDPRRLAMAAERDAAIARTDLFRIRPASPPAPEALVCDGVGTGPPRVRRVGLQPPGDLRQLGPANGWRLAVGRIVADVDAANLREGCIRSRVGVYALGAVEEGRPGHKPIP